MSDLKGLIVISLEHAVAAPYASLKLVDAGARVIKVERPEGDFARSYDSLAAGQSAYFVWLNRGKESIALDLKSEVEAALLRKLVAKADILIQNLGPGALTRLGFDPAELRQQYPQLILCSISGYGSTGPRARQKAYDLLIQAESGLASVTGTPEGPARVGVSVVDIAAGMNAYQAILEALIGRAATGQGRHIEVSMFQAMADWMNVPYLQYRYGGKAPTRQGLRHPTIAPYGVFVCKDDREVLIAIQNDREWRALCLAFGCPEHSSAPETATGEARFAHRNLTDGIVQTHLARINREDAITMFNHARIAFGRLSTMEDIAALPPEHFMNVGIGDINLDLLVPGARVEGTAPPHGRQVPYLNQHGAKIWEEFS